MPIENDLVTVRADDLEQILATITQLPELVYSGEIRAGVERLHIQLHTERRPAEDDTADAELVPMPPGRWGRVELPGRREHTGWLNDELRHGADMLIVRDWNGAELAAVAIGPACRVVYLATPLHRPEPVRAAIAPIALRLETARGLTCRHCSAEPGQQCRTTFGATRTQPHVLRMYAAIRQLKSEGRWPEEADHG